MILATHNSLTYLKPQWWLRPFAWIGRCQSKTIGEQLELGVRYFDIRIKCKKGLPKSGHGLFTYDINVIHILREINTVNNCIVRITLEQKHASKLSKELFYAYCTMMEESFKNITFTGGFQKGTWIQLYSFSSHPEINLSEKYWTWGHGFPYPKFWAKKNNQKYKKKGADYLMLDFIEL